jgi:hypothetical protein
MRRRKCVIDYYLNDRDSVNSHDVPLAFIQALIRDGYKCVVTRKYDIRGRKFIRVDKEEIKRVGCVFTDCVHIVPAAAYFEVSSSSGSEKVNSSHLSAVAAEFILASERLFRLCVRCFEVFWLWFRQPKRSQDTLSFKRHDHVKGRARLV